MLDAGCGEGFVADILQTALPTAQITGFDVLEDSVKLAQRRNPRGTFSTGDIYAGLWYPVIFALITVVIGFFFLPETKDDDISK